MPQTAAGDVELLIYRTINVADEAVKACHEQLSCGHPIRVAMDDAMLRLHDARRATEVIT